MSSSSGRRPAAMKDGLAVVTSLMGVPFALVVRLLRFLAGYPAAAAFCSFVLPGLGQALVGAYRRAAIVAMPAIALVLTMVALVLFDRSAIWLFLTPRVLTSLLLLDLVAFIYHVWAMLDAYLLARKLNPVRPGAGASRWLSVAAVVVLVATAAGIHGWIAAVDLQSQSTLSCVMNPNGPCIADWQSGEPVPSFNYQAEDTPEPVPSGWLAAGEVVLGLGPGPWATPTPADTTAYPLPPACTGGSSSWADRNCTLYLLLIGGDAGIGRKNYGHGPIQLFTDTMILLQVDLSTGRSAMYGIPRNLMNVPLGKTAWNAYPYHFFPALAAYGAQLRWCGTNTNPCLFNALWHDAAFDHPSKYPYPGNYFARGTKAVEDAVSSLMGVHVTGSVVVDLVGFVDLINALAPGGLRINSPYEVRQIPGTPYTNSENVHLYNLVFPKGVQTLDGEKALAYARLRHVVRHDSDYYRMGRQQLVLKALREQLNPCALVPNIPNVLSAIQGTLWTNLDLNDAPEMAALATRISTANIATYPLTPLAGFGNNIYPEIGDTSVLQKYQTRVKTGLNGVPSAFPSGGGGGGGGFHC